MIGRVTPTLGSVMKHARAFHTRAEPSSPWAPLDIGHPSCGRDRAHNPKTQDAAAAAILNLDHPEVDPS